MKTKLTSSIPFALVLTAAMAHGSIFDFTSGAGYSPGALDGQQGWSVSNLPANANIVAGGLSYASGAVVHNGGDQRLSLLGGNRLDMDNPADPVTNPQVGEARASIGLPSTYAPGSTFYFSFLFNHDSGDNFFWLAFADRADSDNGSISALSQNQAVGPSGDQVATPRLRSRIRDASGGQSQGNAPYDGAPIFDGWGLMQPGETQLIVGRVFFGGSAENSTIRVWLNPTSLIEADNPNFFDNSRNMNIAELDTLWIRKGGNLGEAFVDHILIGDSWDAVVIPEPSTYAALFGVFALGLFAWRRRR